MPCRAIEGAGSQKHLLSTHIQRMQEQSASGALGAASWPALRPLAPAGHGQPAHSAAHPAHTRTSTHVSAFLLVGELGAIVFELPRVGPGHVIGTLRELQRHACPAGSALSVGALGVEPLPDRVRCRRGGEWGVLLGAV